MEAEEQAESNLNWFSVSGFQGLGFREIRVSGFEGLGFRGLGFQGLGFQGLELRDLERSWFQLSWAQIHMKREMFSNNNQMKRTLCRGFWMTCRAYFCLGVLRMCIGG